MTPAMLAMLSRIQSRLCGPRNAGGDRQRRRVAAALLALDQNLVELTVIVVGEHHDPVAAGDGAGDPHRRHHGLGPGVAERRAFVPDELGKSFGDRTGQVALRADGKPALHLGGHGVDHEVRRMAEGRLPEPVDQVDVLVAVDIPDSRALGAIADHRVDQFLPFRPEPGRRPWVGQDVAVLLGIGLGFRAAGAVALGEVSGESQLFRCQLAAGRVGGPSDRKPALGLRVGLGRRCRLGGGKGPRFRRRWGRWRLARGLSPARQRGELLREELLHRGQLRLHQRRDRPVRGQRRGRGGQYRGCGRRGGR